MAASPRNEGAAPSIAALVTLNRVGEELMCAVCRETFQSPKTLPCLHTFCAHCLSTYSLVQQRDYKQPPNVVECPTCRARFEYDSGVEEIPTNPTYASLVACLAAPDAASFSSTSSGVAAPPPAPRLRCGKCDVDDVATAVAFCSDCDAYLCDFCRETHKRLRDLRHHRYRDCTEEELAARNEGPSPSHPQSAPLCLRHEGELKLFCVDCDAAICRDCTVVDHRGHNVRTAGDVIEGKKQKLRNEESALKATLESIQATIAKMDGARGQLEGLRSEMVRALASAMEGPSRDIAAQGEGLQAVIDQHFKPRFEEVEDCVNRLRTSKSKVADMLEFVTHGLSEVSDITLLQAEIKNCARLLGTTVSSEVDTSSKLRLVAIPDPVVHEIARVVKEGPARAGKCILTCDKGRVYTQGEAVTIEAHSCDINGNVLDYGGKCCATVSCHISTLGKDYVSHPTVRDHQNGKYTVQFTPECPGINEVRVQVDDSAGSTLELPVARNYVQVTMEPGEFRIANAGPCGLAVLHPHDTLAVSASDGQIHLFDLPGGQKISCIRSNLVRPYAMAVDVQGDMWVTDREGHSVHKFKSDGTKLLQFGQKGSSSGDFLNPRGIVTHPAGRAVYVSDMRNNRVQVFKLDGTYMAQFGSSGKLPGLFDMPAGMCFNRSGHLVVCDDRNCRLQVFDTEGRFLNTIGVKDQIGWLCSPIGVCCDGLGRYIVTEFGSHCISFLDPDGEFLGCVRSVKGYGHFIHPKGVAVDAFGYVYVADSLNMRVIRF